MSFIVGDSVYDMRNINNLDATQRLLQKGVVTSVTTTSYYIQFSDNTVRLIDRQYVASTSIIEPTNVIN